MATRIAVTVEDDLDGGPADETLRFGIGGSDYEIDLSNENARKFRQGLAPFVEHARKAGRGQRRRPARTSSARERSGEIRAWAKARGIPVSDRGRIPAGVAEQCEAATGRSRGTPRLSRRYSRQIGAGRIAAAVDEPHRTCLLERRLGDGPAQTPGDGWHAAGSHAAG